MGRINYPTWIGTCSQYRVAICLSVLSEATGLFPSAALGRLDQNTMQDLSWLDQFKLRLGMGTTATQLSEPTTLGSIRSFPYHLAVWATLAYGTNEPTTSGTTLMANPALEWEKPRSGMWARLHSGDASVVPSISTNQIPMIC